MIKTILWRLIRTSAAMLIAAGGAWAAGDPRYIWLAPIIAAVGKALRDGFGLKNIPI